MYLKINLFLIKTNISLRLCYTYQLNFSILNTALPIINILNKNVFSSQSENDNRITLTLLSHYRVYGSLSIYPTLGFLIYFVCPKKADKEWPKLSKITLFLIVYLSIAMGSIRNLLFKLSKFSR